MSLTQIKQFLSVQASFAGHIKDANSYNLNQEIGRKMKNIFLGILVMFTVIHGDFSKNGNIVTDNSTGLQWQNNETLNKTWTAAIDYCEILSLDGQSDWRLPNKKELLSIVDYGRYNPAINLVGNNSPTLRSIHTAVGNNLS